MRKTIIWFVVVISLFLAACQHNGLLSAAVQKTEQQPTETAEISSFLISNLADQKSREEVVTILKKYLPEKSVDQFMAAVTDYNETIRHTSLNQGFEEAVPEYDMAKISSLWKEAKGIYIGINCRITAFMLLKDAIQIEQGEGDDALLFLDKDAITAGKLFTAEETGQFKQLFSRVKTEATDDIRIHAEKMREHLSKFKFNDNVRMVSVVLHDNLDGDYLFIGHVGVLTEGHGQFIFVEKLTFEEPYQVLKFKQEEDCYQYLLRKYGSYSDEGGAKPFIMVNGEFKCGGDQFCGKRGD